MEEEDLLDDVVYACPTLPPDAVRQDTSLVRHEINSVYIVYDVDFHNLLEAHQKVACDSLNRKVDLV